MRLELSSARSDVASSIFFSSCSYFNDLHGRRRPAAVSVRSSAAQSTAGRRRRQTFLSPSEPPWQVLPPDNSESRGRLELSYTALRLDRAADPVPISLRQSAVDELGVVGRAVFSLACIMEEVNALVVPRGDREATARVSSDTGDSVVWTFQKIFTASPNLFVGLLGLFGSFAAASAESAIPPAATIVRRIGETLNGSRLENWSCDCERRRVAYEHVIVMHKANSLILSNYAQLLYQYAHDIDRAEDYFKLAVAAEPADPVAVSRYAVFLWKERGDTDKAEEMLLEAITMEPDNIYYQSIYVGFLWKTGASDTCFLHDDGGGSQGLESMQW